MSTMIAQEKVTSKDRTKSRKSRELKPAEVSKELAVGQTVVEENRKIVREDDPGVLKTIVHEFATCSQDLASVQSLILAHEHFVKSEVLMEAFILEYFN